MKKLIVMLMIAVVGFSAQAQEKNNKNAKVEFQVSGNCEMCKKRIEKAAYLVQGVKSATWSIETHKLNLIVNEDKTSALTIKKAIAKVGHDANEIKAAKEDYDALHGCCQYERK